MSCEHLICANCAAPVVEGRCPSCRAARQEVHHHHFSASPQVIVAAILLLTLLMLVGLHFGR